jgi:hypothetical protein
MDINFWEAVVILGGIWLVVNVMNGGRWDKKRMRWEKHSPENPYVKAGTLPPAEDLRARRELEDLRARVATLEKLATDPTQRLEREIEALRKRDAPEA